MSWTPVLDDYDDDFSNLKLNEPTKNHLHKSTRTPTSTENHSEPCNEIQSLGTSIDMKDGLGSRTNELIESLKYPRCENIVSSNKKTLVERNKVIPIFMDGEYFKFDESTEQSGSPPNKNSRDFSTIFDDESENSEERSEKEEQAKLNADFYRKLGDSTANIYSSDPPSNSNFSIKLRVRLD